MVLRNIAMLARVENPIDAGVIVGLEERIGVVDHSPVPVWTGVLSPQRSGFGTIVQPLRQVALGNCVEVVMVSDVEGEELGNLLFILGQMPGHAEQFLNKSVADTCVALGEELAPPLLHARSCVLKANRV